MISLLYGNITACISCTSQSSQCLIITVQAGFREQPLRGKEWLSGWEWRAERRRIYIYTDTEF